MFAIPFTAPSHAAFGHHLLGRFLSRSAPPAAGVAVAQAMPAAAEAAVAEDAFPDLAQRVREVGEW
jgi:hypothetical protein